MNRNVPGSCACYEQSRAIDTIAARARLLQYALVLVKWTRQTFRSRPSMMASQQRQEVLSFGLLCMPGMLLLGHGGG